MKLIEDESCEIHRPNVEKGGEDNAWLLDTRFGRKPRIAG